MYQFCKVRLQGSWVVISGVISRVTIIITHKRGLITPLLAAREPPSSRYPFLKGTLATLARLSIKTQPPSRSMLLRCSGGIRCACHAEIL